MSACSQCLRALRRRPLPLQLNGSTSSAQVSRCISTSIPRRQQAQPPQSQQEQVPPAAPIPTTSPTVTSNVTAPTPPAGTTEQYKQEQQSQATRQAQPPIPNLSTSQMQKTISSNLARPTNTITRRLAQGLRNVAPAGVTDSYITYGLTEAIFNSCAGQASYTVPEDQRMGIYTGKGPPKNADQEDLGIPDNVVKDADGKSFWFDTLELEPTFSTWSQVTFLHMYILTVKLRTLPSSKEFLDYQRYLLEHFSNNAEDKMGLLHGMTARGIRNRYLKDLFIQWRGILYAYDQGIVSGDAVLASAVWRNLWKAKDNADWEKVAMVVGYMRRAIRGLDRMNISEIAKTLETGSTFWEDCRTGLVKDVTGGV